MENHPIEGLMLTAMSSIENMIDVNTIIGNPVTTPDGTTIIPISKVSFGFASGGSDIPAKVEKEVVVTIEEKLIDDSEDDEANLVGRAPVVVVMEVLHKQLLMVNMLNYMKLRKMDLHLIIGH